MKQSSRPDKRPSFQFYPDDWLAEAGLRMCNLEARGLWADLICFMFQSEERGIIRSKGELTLSETLSRMVGKEQSKVEAALKQLRDFGVAEITETAIHSRRMVRDEKQRLSKVLAGRKGGFAKEASKRLADTLAEPVAKARSSSPTPSSFPTPTPKTSLRDEEVSHEYPPESEGKPVERADAEKVAVALQEAAKANTGGKGRLKPLFHDADRIQILLSQSDYSVDDLLAMVAFAKDDDHWRTIILTGAKLEKHADALAARILAAKSTSKKAEEKVKQEPGWRPQPPMVDLKQYEHRGKNGLTHISEIIEKIGPPKPGSTAP